MPEFIIPRFERHRGLYPRDRNTAENFWIIQQAANEKIAHTRAIQH